MPLTLTPNYALKKYGQGEHPGANALNSNWTKIDEVLGELAGDVVNLEEASFLTMSPEPGIANSRRLIGTEDQIDLTEDGTDFVISLPSYVAIFGEAGVDFPTIELADPDYNFVSGISHISGSIGDDGLYIYTTLPMIRLTAEDGIVEVRGGFASPPHEIRVFGEDLSTKYTRIMHNGIDGQVNAATGDLYVTGGTGGSVHLGPAGAPTAWSVSGATGHMFPGLNNTFDFGAVGNLPRNVYAGTQFIGPAAGPSGPTYTYAGVTNWGHYFSGGGYVALSVAGTEQYAWGGGGFVIGQLGVLAFSGSTIGAYDTFFERASAGVMNLHQNPTSGAARLQIFGDASDAIVVSHDGTHCYVYNSGAGDFYLGESATSRWYLQSGAGHLIPVVGNIYDFGSVGTQVRSGYFGTSVEIGSYLVMGAGSNPSTVGTIRMANNTYITARDSTNSSNAQVIGLTSSDDITIFGGAWFFRGTGRLTAGGNYGFSHGVSALATTATEGFLFIQSCAGTPTGVPANIPSGQIAAVYDSTNKKVYLYDGGWKRAQVGGVDAVWA